MSCSQEVIVLQYTGVEDKNGVSIYEGDILKSTYVAFDDTLGFYRNYIVDDIHTYKRTSFDGYSRNVDAALAFDINTSFTNFKKQLKHQAYEIIGNKYENPELLKGLNKL